MNTFLNIVDEGMSMYAIDLFRSLEKGTEERAAHSDSLGNSRNLGNPYLAPRLHLPSKSSYLRFICTFRELYDNCLS